MDKKHRAVAHFLIENDFLESVADLRKSGLFDLHLRGYLDNVVNNLFIELPGLQNITLTFSQFSRINPTGAPSFEFLSKANSKYFCPYFKEWDSDGYDYEVHFSDETVVLATWEQNGYSFQIKNTGSTDFLHQDEDGDVTIHDVSFAFMLPLEKPVATHPFIDEE